MTNTVVIVRVGTLVNRCILFSPFFRCCSKFSVSLSRRKNSPAGAEAHFCCFKHFGKRGWWERMSKCMRSAPGELEGCHPGRQNRQSGQRLGHGRAKYGRTRKQTLTT